MNDKSISRFWEKFIEKTRNYDVKQSSARWYVIHAEQYIKHYSDVKLVDHQASFVELYLKMKCSQKRMEYWRYLQIVTSLNILFSNMVQVGWSNQFPWEEWMNYGKKLPDSDADSVKQLTEKELNFIKTSLKDKSDTSHGLFNKVYAQHHEHVDNLIKTIRLSH